MILKISQLTSAKILKLSSGEVRVPDTFNYKYKIPKAVPGGLFCEKIFGPIESYECECKKFVGKQYAGIVCRNCGVKVGSSFLRYNRIGHVEFALPIIRPMARMALFKIFGKKEDLINGKLCIRTVEDKKGKFYNTQGQRISFEYVQTFRQTDFLGLSLLPDIIYNIDFDKSRSINPVIDSLMESGANPYEYILFRIPVMPPGYRPIIETDNCTILGDINIHYMKIIKNSQNLFQLRKFATLRLITFWSRYLLQRSVDNLMLYGTTHLGKRVKPTTETLRGKYGRIRNNLLGKRTDYSGRSVLVVSPTIPSDTVELPIKMAYELFKPFIISRLYKKKRSYRKAKYAYTSKSEEAIMALKDIIKTHKVILNRQPTLHRYGMLAFKIKLTNSKAVKMPPLVFAGFNADVDGDQIAVHVPLSEKALSECERMLPTNNIISSSNSQPVISLSHEIIIGLYYMTNIKSVDKPRQLSSYDNATYLYQAGHIDINELILLRKKETCYGRLLIEDTLGFEINNPITKKSISKIINRCFDIYEDHDTLSRLDKLKSFGYEYATLQGFSLGMDDIKVPSTKYQRFQEVEDYCNSLKNETSNEKSVRAWYECIRNLKDVALEELGEDNPLKVMLDTGARVKANQIVQLVVAKGLISNWKGEILEPIRNSLTEGLTPFEFLTSVYGSRKSMADKKFITPKTGYLTRRLVTAMRDLYIVKKDCGTNKTLSINGIEKRSPIMCEAKNGICQKCYGIDPATRKRIKKGTPIGVISAQSVSEPTTQLSMRTFHFGGAAIIKSSPLNILSRTDGTVTINKLNDNINKVTVENSKDKRKYFVNMNHAEIKVENNQEIFVDDVIATYYRDVGQEDISGKIDVVEHYYEIKHKIPKCVVSKMSGTIELSINEENPNAIDIFIDGEFQGKVSSYAIHYGSGDYVKIGTILTYGEVYLDEIYKDIGLEKTGELFVKRMVELYKEEGITISPVHFEVIYRAMTELVINNNNNIDLRRTIEPDNIKEILLKGITQIGKMYPSWLKQIGFGWSKKCLEEVSMNDKVSLDLPSERIITGELLIKED